MGTIGGSLRRLALRQQDGIDPGVHGVNSAPELAAELGRGGVDSRAELAAGAVDHPPDPEQHPDAGQDDRDHVDAFAQHAGAAAAPEQLMGRAPAGSSRGPPSTASGPMSHGLDLLSFE